jgi:hypothetical protein
MLAKCCKHEQYRENETRDKGTCNAVQWIHVFFSPDFSGFSLLVYCRLPYSALGDRLAPSQRGP